MLPNVQVTARRTRALGIFKGAGSAGYRLLGGLRRSAFAVPVRAAEAELPHLPATGTSGTATGSVLFRDQDYVTGCDRTSHKIC